MREGWWNDQYLILFDPLEIPAATDRYALAMFVPGYAVIGLRGWDDLIVRDVAGRTFCVPAVPLSSKYIEPFSAPNEEANLESDSPIVGKIKWHVHPLFFGGDTGDTNTDWINHQRHAELVRLWNNKYREIAR